MPHTMTPAPPWRVLGRFMLRHRATSLTVLGWSLLEALPALCSGLLVAGAVDEGFLAGRPLKGFAWLLALAGSMGVQALVTRTLVPRLGRLVEPLRDELVTSVVTSAVHRAVAGSRGGDSASVARLTSQVESVRALVSALLRSARQFGVTLVMALVGLTVLAPPVAALVLPPVLLTLVASLPLLQRLARRQRQRLLAEEDMTARAGDAFAGLRDVVACGAQDSTARDIGECVDRHAEASRAVARMKALNTLLLGVGGWLPVLVVLLAASRLLGDGTLTVGGLVGAVTYLASHVEPALRALVMVLGTWGVELDTVLRRLVETTTPTAAPPAPRRPGDTGAGGTGAGGTGAHPRRPRDATGAGPGGPADGAGPEASRGMDLVIDGLTFAYGPRAEPVIRSLSLEIRHGTHLAVVGPSGVGKSTLATLIAGLVPPSEGGLSLGGVRVDKAGREWLSRHVALIPQEAYVFTGTLRDNLRYLRPDATDAELTRSVTAVGADMLLDRAGGLDGYVGLDGPTLSAGEKQLLALARAHVSRAAVVVLDEASCHLDAAREARAENAFAGRGATLIVIAHRISSALRAERILVMDGESTVTGTHSELRARSALYADLTGHWLAGDPDPRPRTGVPPPTREAPA